ncbi:GNS1/SUR4 family protein [Thecamonas trahens ATCC 50062]|uniref:Elongation of fatty acids protein n=1 Tax=Thecamonas trahens ATCC 50062 TaxID=461836 RepID=A0A0L0DI95_THETB|nr:GNS1/SUR4 family protein [Thecamonas trahens ATCC 50062]KNC51038.1 GNS1/SUR4 family protein [Thecamonas trahens ATCC 50062]|eukprot:XP_013756505.1 GNS1/SUR4 family protein [Thecamonas trahens ATCC 50062]
MTGVLAYFCWMYYVSKYYELFDTLLMVVKHKPLTVLHLWHHAVIGPMSLTWLRGNWAIHWYGAAVNTLIHVFMYYYYFASKAYGHRPWWRVYITQGQITQFFSVFFMIWAYVYFDVRSGISIGAPAPGEFLPSLNYDRGCVGHPWTIAFAQFVNITFLGLFINFYVQTYKRGKAATKAKSS